MKYRRTIDPDCPSCYGHGEVVETSGMGDGTWISSFDCHCVEHHHDDEMKAFLARICSVTSHQRGEP